MERVCRATLMAETFVMIKGTEAGAKLRAAIVDMRHDFKSPLANIITIAEYLKNDMTEPNQAELKLTDQHQLSHPAQIYHPPKEKKCLQLWSS